MIATIERVWRRLRQQPLVPAAMLVIGVRLPADPVRRGTGYVGVLPVPTSSATATVARPDQPVDQSRRDVRTARGRVLYATGHAPQPAPQPAERKATCTDRRVGQSKPSSTSPNS
jgi:hypothetical protein